MDGSKGSEAWEKRTKLARDIKAMIDIILKYYDPEIYAGLGLVMRLDRKQIRLKYTEYGALAYDEVGVLRIDHMKKIEVKKRSHDVLDESHKYVYDLHDRIS